MRIFVDLASHDTTGTPPGGRIVRTDSSEKVGEETPINGQFVFYAPEGASLNVDKNSFILPQSSPQSVPARAAAEFLIRYPMYDHVLYNFYLDNNDVNSYDLSTGISFPTSINTFPAFSLPFDPAPLARCQVGRGAGPGSIGMAPNSVAVLPASVNRANPVYGSLVTTKVDLWGYNPLSVRITGPVAPGSVILIKGIPLTAVGAPRVSGSDDFDSTGAPSVVAADIAAAINDPANSFATFVLATVDPVNPALVQLRPIPASNTTVTLNSPSAGISTVESHPGTQDMMLWWKASYLSVTQDQGLAVVGSNAGKNDPAVKSTETINPDHPDLLVYVSVDDGTSWYRVKYLEPVDVVTAGTDLRVCFVNVGSSKIFIHGFCALFSDLPDPM